jgi:ankyrin repeat protein
MADDVRVLKLLLDNDIDAFARNKYGITPLMWSCTAKGYKCTELLLAHILVKRSTTHVHVKDRQRGRTAFMWACSNMHQSGSLKALFESGIITSEHANDVDDYGHTPLRMACESQRAQSVKLLLSNSDRLGIDVNSFGNSMETPLMVAVRQPDTDILKLLLAHRDIQVNAANAESGLTALMRVTNPESLKMLLAHPSTALGFNMQDDNGQTALMRMMDMREGKGAEMLLEAATKRTLAINAADRDGMTALMHACQHSASAVRVVLKYADKFGLDVNAVDYDEATALIHACLSNPYAATALLEHDREANKMDVNARVGSNMPTALEILFSTQDRVGVCDALHMMLDRPDLVLPYDEEPQYVWPDLVLPYDKKPQYICNKRKLARRYRIALTRYQERAIDREWEKIKNAIRGMTNADVPDTVLDMVMQQHTTRHDVAHDLGFE